MCGRGHRTVYSKKFIYKTEEKMKNRIKSFLAAFLAVALVLTATPLSGFAAGNSITLKNGTLLNSENNPFEGKLTEGDTITGDGNMFYVTVNGTKDEDASHYGAESFKGLKEDSSESGNTYYKNYTVPAAPEGYEATATLTVTENEDFTDAELKNKGKVINLTFAPVTAPKEFSITYYSNGKKYGEPQTYKAGDKIVPPEAPEAAEGHVFNGWVINEKQDKLPETMPENNLEASASWKLKDISITFITDDTEYKKATAPFASSMENTVPEDPKKEGYVFAGWFDQDGKNVFEYKTVPSEDITFTAKWLKNGNVVYTSNGKTYAAYEVKEGDKIPVPEENPEKFAHKFVGWTPEIPEKMPAEDLTFDAKYEIDKNFVTIAIGGTLIAGGIIGITSAAITGLSIVGGIIAIIGLSSIVGNISKTYKVTYKVDGKVYKTYNIAEGKKITTPADPEKEGFIFAGWTPEVPEKMPKQDLTFDAKWSKSESTIPDTGSESGIAALAILAVAAAAAIIFAKKKKDD